MSTSKEVCKFEDVVSQLDEIERQSQEARDRFQSDLAWWFKGLLEVDGKILALASEPAVDDQCVVVKLLEKDWPYVRFELAQHKSIKYTPAPDLTVNDERILRKDNHE